MINKHEEIINDAIDRVEECCAELTTMVCAMPHLHIISTSNDGPSEVYMKGKLTVAAKFGLQATKHTVTPDNIMTTISELAKDLNNKIIIQLPLGNPEDYPRLGEMLELIHPLQDVDGFKVPLIDINVMREPNDFITHPTFSPTAKGALMLNMLADDKVKGREVTVIGKGLTSGLPITMMYNQLGATVHTVNTNTDHLLRSRMLMSSDIIVSCCGANINIPMYDAGAKHICINVGMRREDNVLKGDLNYDELKDDGKIRFINPVKGSTGKLTTLFLIYNCLASQMTHGVEQYNRGMKENELV